MVDLATVRAEIKAWERSFKESNGRAATIDDVKQNDAIAEQYKIYKRLSKAAEKEKSPPRPLTPPRLTRPKDPLSGLLSRSRVIQSTAPLTAFNPFSPQKKRRGKEREYLSPDIGDPRRNLFGTSGSTSSSQGRSLSPNPFPSIQPCSSTSSSEISLPPAPTSAILRARKRLRGEPVSPSPNKGKRRRVLSQNTNPFPRLNLDVPGSDDEMETKDTESSFVDNSPVKAPVGGKVFSQLFVESSLAPTDLFGIKSKPEALNTSQRSSLQKSTHPVCVQATRKLMRNGSGDPSSGHFNSTISPQTPVTWTSSETLEHSITRSTNKRLASDEETGNDPQLPMRSKSPLIPPSPPPSGHSNSTAFNRLPKVPTKGQAVSKSRKKAKIDDQTTSDSDETDLNAKLKVVNRHITSLKRTGGVQDDIDDLIPTLSHTRFVVPRAASPNNAGGHVEVNLPDELLRMLALESVALQAEIPDEEKLVKNLLYGRRTTHYDPTKGGEIWDIGEDHHTGIYEEGLKIGEGEDDWEGEPVPWEIAEL